MFPSSCLGTQPPINQPFGQCLADTPSHSNFDYWINFTRKGRATSCQYTNDQDLLAFPEHWQGWRLQHSCLQNIYPSIQLAGVGQIFQTVKNKTSWKCLGESALPTLSTEQVSRILLRTSLTINHNRQSLYHLNLCWGVNVFVFRNIKDSAESSSSKVILRDPASPWSFKSRIFGQQIDFFRNIIRNCFYHKLISMRVFRIIV